MRGESGQWVWWLCVLCLGMGGYGFRWRGDGVIAAPGMETIARRLVSHDPGRFMFHDTHWGKFPDGTDLINIGGFQPQNQMAGSNVLLMASFHSNDVTLSQFSVMITLLQSFINSLTVVLPFYPVGTMERITQEGQVATANTYAQLFSNLPSCGKPTRLVTYDLHTLQNRFYLHGNTIASLQTSLPLLIQRIRRSEINAIAFPDNGASKRFSEFFRSAGFSDIITCGKTRDGERRSVSIQDGCAMGKHVIVVDDLVQSGGTLHQCGLALAQAGAASVSAFVAHGVFPNQAWRRFLSGGDAACFKAFYVTNSCLTVTDKIPTNNVFEVLPLEELIVGAL